MDNQAQDGNSCRMRDLVGLDFGAQNEPKITFVEACESKLIPQWFWDCFAARFSLIWTPLWKSFWAYFGMQNLGKANQAHPRKSLKNHQFLHDFAKAAVLFESQMTWMNDIFYPLRTASCLHPSSDQFFTSFGRHLALHLDPFGPPKPVRTMIRIRGQKMIKVRLPSGLSGGAPPYIGGNPPSGPAGAGRVGLSPVGV